ncbi:hypothetical protein PV350_40075 [Streptomyces sp. PA03-6a]|nr:hypothetical protein [Streptomyces sp. PA03-6a]
MPTAEATSLGFHLVVRGGPAVTVQGIDDIVRTRQPSGLTRLPLLRSSRITTPPDVAAVFGEDVEVTLISEGDARVWLAKMVNEAPSRNSACPGLALSTSTPGRRTCTHVSVLAQGELGDAVLERALSRSVLASVLVSVGLSDRRRNTSAQRSTAITLLFLRRKLRAGRTCAWCQWELLDLPGIGLRETAVHVGRKAQVTPGAGARPSLLGGLPLAPASCPSVGNECDSFGSLTAAGTGPVTSAGGAVTVNEPAPATPWTERTGTEKYRTAPPVWSPAAAGLAYWAATTTDHVPSARIELRTAMVRCRTCAGLP